MTIERSNALNVKRVYRGCANASLRAHCPVPSNERFGRGLDHHIDRHASTLWVDITGVGGGQAVAVTTLAGFWSSMPCLQAWDKPVSQKQFDESQCLTREDKPIEARTNEHHTTPQKVPRLRQTNPSRSGVEYMSKSRYISIADFSAIYCHILSFSNE
jgi:hypothetical protein